MSDFSPIQNLVPAGNNIFQAVYGSDAGLSVEFYWRAVEDVKKSEAEGRKIYSNKPYIKISPIGDKTKKIDRPVNMKPSGNVPSDPDRFPRQWLKFNQNAPQQVEGTLIQEWPPLTPADAENFKAMGIYTVEQLAALGDNNVSGMGMRAWRQKAQVWLSSAKGGAENLKLQAEVDRLRTEVQGLINQQQGFAPLKPKKAKKNVENPATDDSTGL
jgi:hypothetical protein